MSTMTLPFGMRFLDLITKEERGFKDFSFSSVYNPKTQTSNTMPKANEDIDFVRSFKKRIMTQTDPLALLRKIDERPRASSHTHTDVTHRPTQEPHASVSSRRGCFGFAALLLFIIICLIVVLN